MNNLNENPIVTTVLGRYLHSKRTKNKRTKDLNEVLREVLYII